ncbi:oligosaccharide flippase family protein [Pseudoalteromonas sp. SWXJZ94C]|uniref:oligosaccharide flippase family protein n=1 Tax=unclassified Pseudoalteromonas TaxID=194690 RepID=UPI001409E79C|nr:MULTISPECIES: oligosaccharide flippase family protein [unclassified Pseudoalteromonas]MBH0057960.1 oligosaccharide flippase family protein [Pseudoalteromonas sp. SWXJZ94C]
MSNKKQGLWILSSSGIAGLSQFAIYFLIAFFGDAEKLGILAIVNIVVSVIFLIQDFGLASYFIHKQDIDNPQKNALHFVNLGLGGFASLIMFALAYPISVFYEEPIISTCLLILSVNFLLLGGAAQYQAHFIKSGKNILLAKIDIISKMSLLAVTFLLIKSDVSVLFSYVYGVVITSIVRLALLLLLAEKSWHPNFQVDWTIVKPALKFGGYQMGSQIINQLKTQLDQIVIGKIMGLEALGIYSFAKEMVLQPVKFIRPLIGRLFYPNIAKMQKDNKAFLGYLNSFVTQVSFLNLGLFVMIFFFFYIFSDLVLGDKYQGFLPIFTILLIIGMLRPIGFVLGVAAQAKGRADHEFLWNLITSFISVIIVFAFASLNDLILFSYAMGVLQIALTIFAVVYFSKREIKLSLPTILTILLPILSVYALLNIYSF